MTKMELPEKIEFDASLPLVTARMDEALLQSDELITDIMRHLAASNGKNFRSRLLLAASVDAEGYVPRDAVTAAAALEILHLATLVHDDVIDDAATRRGKASIQHRFGKKSAVICGDYLFCKCFLLTAGISERYQDKFTDIAKMMSKICMGELRQYRHNGDTALSLREYLRIIAGKTSALFAMALYAGAILGGSDEKEARLLGQLGYYIGIIFQLEDDCMDYASNLATVGKNVQHDLAEGVVTLPLIFAMAKKPEIRSEIKDFHLSPAEYRAVIDEVCHLGGVEMTLQIADRYYGKARRLLERVTGESRRARLRPILDTIRLRKF